MPIRPENVDRYPDDWPAISLGIRRDRAGWRCECLGECGMSHANGRHARGRCPNRHGSPSVHTGKRVVLTVAHLDHTPEHCHPTNLKAMCQGCHLRYDRDHHRQTAAATRARALADAGQLTLPMEPPCPPA